MQAYNATVVRVVVLIRVRTYRCVRKLDV